MSQSPPAYPNQQFQPVPPAPGPKNNGWAIASLICGILGCIPVVTSLLAAIFGIVGIRKAKEPGTSGKGLAIAGLVLGIIGLIGWSAGGVFGYMVWQNWVTPVRNTGQAFISSLTSGDLSAAKKYTTDDFPEGRLAAIREQVKSYGSFKGVTITKLEPHPEGSQLRVALEGTANFDKASKGFSASLIGSAKSGFKVEDFDLR